MAESDFHREGRSAPFDGANNPFPLTTPHPQLARCLSLYSGIYRSIYSARQAASQKLLLRNVNSWRTGGCVSLVALSIFLTRLT
jgi:hypothetical protein